MYRLCFCTVPDFGGSVLWQVCGGLPSPPVCCHNLVSNNIDNIEIIFFNTLINLVKYICFCKRNQ